MIIFTTQSIFQYMLFNVLQIKVGAFRKCLMMAQSLMLFWIA